MDALLLNAAACDHKLKPHLETGCLTGTLKKWAKEDGGSSDGGLLLRHYGNPGVIRPWKTVENTGSNLCNLMTFGRMENRCLSVSVSALQVGRPFTGITPRANDTYKLNDN